MIIMCKGRKLGYFGHVQGNSKAGSTLERKIQQGIMLRIKQRELPNTRLAYDVEERT